MTSVIKDRLPSQSVYLSTLSFDLFRIISEQNPISIYSVLEQMISLYSIRYPDTYNEKSIKRRVYDAINVMIAIGLIKKEGKELTLIIQKDYEQPSRLTEEEVSAKERCQELESTLIQKAKSLLLYRALIERNRYMQRPRNSIDLPAIFIGIQEIDGALKEFDDKKKLIIEGDCNPMFFSPVDVLEKSSLQIQTQRGYLLSHPELRYLDSKLFSNVYSDEPSDESQ